MSPSMSDLRATKASFFSGVTSQSQSITARVYRCPEDGTTVRIIPLSEPLSGENEFVTCPNGHTVSVPKYHGGLSPKS